MTKRKRMSLTEAKAQAADWEAQRDQYDRDNALATWFQGASVSEVIKMWETGKNEHGRKLSQFEFGALVERWIEVFGTLPPDDEAEEPAVDQPTHPPEPEPEDDTMLRVPEVVRLTGLSKSTITRMVHRRSLPHAHAPFATSDWLAGARREGMD